MAGAEGHSLARKSKTPLTHCCHCCGGTNTVDRDKWAQEVQTFVAQKYHDPEVSADCSQQLVQKLRSEASSRRLLGEQIRRAHFVEVSRMIVRIRANPVEVAELRDAFMSCVADADPQTFRQHARGSRERPSGSCGGGLSGSSRSSSGLAPRKRGLDEPDGVVKRPRTAISLVNEIQSDVDLFADNQTLISTFDQYIWAEASRRVSAF